MSLSPKLEFRQTQSLVMTPQLMQAIKLLQLSNLDLVSYVDAELERNPLLERDERDELGEAAPPPEKASDLAEQQATALDVAEDRPDWLETRLEVSPDSIAERLDTDLSNVFPDDHGHAAGYMRGSLAAIAERLGTDVAEVEAVLAILQTFEPTGICARDLPECLGIQLKERNRFDPPMAALLSHLDLAARRDFAALRKVCGVDDEDLAEMLGELRALNPKPGARFGSAPMQPIVPDVVVRPAPDGSWLIELNTDTLPRVLVNQSYYAKVVRSTKDTERAYLADCLQTANWLVKSLDQRAKTILKVATEIVRQQDGFLTHGVRHLRPLNLKTIAEAIGMHESTVSRVTSNKYMATPRGIFELKYFFTSAIASSEGGEAHSAEAVRHRIRSLIDAESADDILSDDTLVKLLRDSGIDIARRTVAKYREALRIPSSVQRRREKQADPAMSR